MELNSQQKHAVAHARTHVLVLAGAGTGKTRTIIARAAHLVQKGVHPNRILLLAFTRRAAKEMKDRLHHMIGESHRTLMAGTFTTSACTPCAACRSCSVWKTSRLSTGMIRFSSSS